MPPGGQLRVSKEIVVDAAPPAKDASEDPAWRRHAQSGR
jgi:hypothetical protein